MSNFKDMVPAQYKDSPNLERLSTIALDRYPDQTRTLKEIDLLTRIDTAQGKNLDDLGDIIGYARPLAAVVSGARDLFAFETGVGLGYTSVLEPVQGGVWNTIEIVGDASKVGDFTYRYLLKLKVIRNVSAGTPDAIIRAVIALAGTIPTLIEGTAEFTLKVPGLDSGIINLRDMFQLFLPRPLGVTMTLEEDPITSPASILGRYTGTGSIQAIVVPSMDFDVGFFHYWIKAIDDTGPHEQIMTTYGYGVGFSANEDSTAHRSGLVRASGNTFEIETDDRINRDGVTYEYIIMPLPRKHTDITNHGLAVDHGINDYSGMQNIIYTGSGQEGQLIKWSLNKYTIFAVIKDMDDDSYWAFITPQYADRMLNISSAGAAKIEDGLPRVEAGGLYLKNAYNKKNHRYSIWLMTYSSTQNAAIRITGDGQVGRVITIGMDIGICFYKRVDSAGDWIVVTKDYAVGENSTFNNDTPVMMNGKIKIDGQTLILNDGVDVNEDGAKYIAIIIK